MQRGRRNADTLGTAWHGRIVDRLHIDVEAVHQLIGHALAQLRIANHERDDMGFGAAHHRQIGVDQHFLQRRRLFLMPRTLKLRGLQVTDRGQRTCSKSRGQGGGEDKAGGMAANEVTERGRGGDITTHDAEGLAQRTLDDGQAIHQPFTLGDTATARAIHANRMDLVQIGHGIVLVGQITNLGDWRNVAIH